MRDRLNGEKEKRLPKRCGVTDRGIRSLRGVAEFANGLYLPVRCYILVLIIHDFTAADSWSWHYRSIGPGHDVVPTYSPSLADSSTIIEHHLQHRRKTVLTRASTCKPYAIYSIVRITITTFDLPLCLDTLCSHRVVKIVVVKLIHVPLDETKSNIESRERRRTFSPDTYAKLLLFCMYNEIEKFLTWNLDYILLNFFFSQLFSRFSLRVYKALKETKDASLFFTDHVMYSYN